MLHTEWGRTGQAPQHQTTGPGNETKSCDQYSTRIFFYRVRRTSPKHSPNSKNTNFRCCDCMCCRPFHEGGWCRGFCKTISEKNWQQVGRPSHVRFGDVHIHTHRSKIVLKNIFAHHMLWKQSYAGTHHHYCKHHRAQEKPNKYKVGIPVYIIIILLCRGYFEIAFPPVVQGQQLDSQSPPLSQNSKAF